MTVQVHVPQNAVNVQRDYDPDKAPKPAHALLGNGVPEYDADHLSSGLYALSKELAEQNPEAQHRGFLGGEFGYGQEFKNEVFEMFPYWWGDCKCDYGEAVHRWRETHRHGQGCYQSEFWRRGRAAGLEYWDGKRWVNRKRWQGRWEDLCKAETAIYKALCKKHRIPWNRGFGCGVHCTCDRDRLWAEWSSQNTHRPECPLARPNFKYYKSGLGVCWYKYIGRGMTCNQPITLRQFLPIAQECLQSIQCEALRRA